MFRLYKTIRKWLCFKYEWHKPNGTLLFNFKSPFQESECEFCEQEITRRIGKKWYSTETKHDWEK